MDPFIGNDLSRIMENIRIPIEKMSTISIPRMPSLQEVLKNTQKGESAGAMIARLAFRIKSWKTKLPQNQQPVILAVLPNGVQINVETLSQESHHGVLVEGDVNGKPCMLLCHQATLQLLCFVAEVKKEEEKREIGFHFNPAS